MTVNANTMSYGMWRRVVWFIGGIILEECGASILRCLNNEGSRFLRKAGIYYHLPHQKDDSLNGILLLGEAYQGSQSITFLVYFVPSWGKKKPSIKNTNISHMWECIIFDKKDNQEQSDKLLFLCISSGWGGLGRWELLSDVYSI